MAAPDFRIFSTAPLVYHFMNVIVGTILALIVPVAGWSQAAETHPEFEVASIRPSAPLGTTQVNAGVHVDGAMVACTALSLKDYLYIAYRVKVYQVSGPDWLASERFDVTAKLPEGATRDQVPAMLQKLLADRFEMKMHREMKDFPVYGVVVGKGGPKLKEAPLDVESEDTPGGRGAVNVSASGGRAGTTINFGKGSYFTFADNKIEGKKLTMENFASTLARFVDRPVVDATGLKGNYDFTLTFTPEDFRAMMIRAAIAAGVNLPAEALRLLEGVSDEGLFAAVQTLGLKLESRKAPLDMLVVDSMRKVPTAN